MSFKSRKICRRQCYAPFLKLCVVTDLSPCHPMSDTGPFSSSVIVPLVKCKTKNLSDVENCRTIAISNSMSKLFESVILNEIIAEAVGDEFQYGFKPGVSTAMCTKVLKTTIDYYNSRDSHVFCCFVDYSKAFDFVNYWQLFSKLLKDGVNSKIVCLLATGIVISRCVCWGNTFSNFFSVSNGTRPGCILSPYLFARYIRDLLCTLAKERVGCNIGRFCKSST